jgi:hypothetical protein
MVLRVLLRARVQGTVICPTKLTKHGYGVYVFLLKVWLGSLFCDSVSATLGFNLAFLEEVSKGFVDFFLWFAELLGDFGQG